MGNANEVYYSFSMGKGLFLFSCILYMNMSYSHTHILSVFMKSVSVLHSLCLLKLCGGSRIGIDT